MIVPHIRNHAHIGLQNAMLRTALIFGLQCHALDHQNFRILGGSTAQNADLRRRKPDSLRIIHSLRHVIQQVIESFVEMLHRPANFV